MHCLKQNVNIQISAWMYIYIYQCMLEKISNYIYLLNEAYKLEQKCFRKKKFKLSKEENSK